MSLKQAWKKFSLSLPSTSLNLLLQCLRVCALVQTANQWGGIYRSVYHSYSTGSHGSTAVNKLWDETKRFLHRTQFRPTWNNIRFLPRTATCTCDKWNLFILDTFGQPNMSWRKDILLHYVIYLCALLASSDYYANHKELIARILIVHSLPKCKNSCD